MKTVNEKVWAEVFGVEIPADETLKGKKDATPAVVNPGVLDDDDSSIEGVCVMDFSGFCDFVNENGIYKEGVKHHSFFIKKKDDHPHGQPSSQFKRNK